MHSSCAAPVSSHGTTGNTSPFQFLAVAIIANFVLGTVARGIQCWQGEVLAWCRQSHRSHVSVLHYHTCSAFNSAPVKFILRKSARCLHWDIDNRRMSKTCPNPVFRPKHSDLLLHMTSLPLNKPEFKTFYWNELVPHVNITECYLVYNFAIWPPITCRGSLVTGIALLSARVQWGDMQKR